MNRAPPMRAAPAHAPWRWSPCAALRAIPGLPIPVHAPKLLAGNHGGKLTAPGVMPGGLRLADVMQDPLPGWFAETPVCRDRLSGRLAAGRGMTR